MISPPPRRIRRQTRFGTAGVKLWTDTVTPASGNRFYTISRWSPTRSSYPPGHRAERDRTRTNRSSARRSAWDSRPLRGLLPRPIKNGAERARTYTTVNDTLRHRRMSTRLIVHFRSSSLAPSIGAEAPSATAYDPMGLVTPAVPSEGVEPSSCRPAEEAGVNSCWRR